MLRERILEFIPGCQRMGKEFRPQHFNCNPINSGVRTPDIEADWNAFDILGWSLAPGDAVAFDILTPCSEE